MVMPSKEFWSGKRVLITGHTGFKGAWLSLWLVTLGARVTGYALPADQDSLYATAGLDRRVRSMLGDIRDSAQLGRAFAEAEPEIVIHLAAQSLVRASYRDPVGTFMTNVIGTIHVLECARATPEVHSVVNVTSDKCYENREWIWAYRENEALGGADPYSASKACAELAISAWRSSFCNREGARLASARAGNVIGGGDWAEDRLVPDCIRALRTGDLVVLRNPGAVRPWQHVLDPLAGYLILAERLHRGDGTHAEGWNFGPLDSGNPRPASWICERIANQWGISGPAYRLDGGANPHEAHSLRVDCSKAVMRLGWSPRLSIDEAVDWTVDWYRRHAGGEEAEALSLEQIERYCDHARVG
jgi:CDP-glucose 4,6-dehydratase